MKLKKLLYLGLLVLFMTSVLTGCKGSPVDTKSPADINTEGVLNLFNWSEYLPESVIEEFEDKHKIKVNYMTYTSNEEMLARIMAGDDVFDLSVASDYLVDVMRKQKLMEEIDMTNIPNIKNIGEQFKNLPFDLGNKYSVPYMWGTGVIAVNTKIIPGNIASYADLWDTKFKNSLVVLDDQRELIGIALKKLGYSNNETDPVKLEHARQELLKLKVNIKSFNSESPKTELINGSAAAGYMWGAEAALAQKENKDIKIFFPKEGMNIWQDNFVIPKGAVNKKNAELFINYILDPQVSAKISKEFPYANPNLAAHQYIDQSTLMNIAVYPTQDYLKIGERIKDVEDATKLYDKIWVEVRGN
jgi:spermidine/putrescine transport system permease protein